MILKNKHVSIFLFILFFLIVLKCGFLNSKEISLGNDLNNEGTITQKSLSYNFIKKQNLKTYKDLFNYIYFQGDTLCFSINTVKDFKNSEVKVYYIYLKNKKKYKAERIEVEHNKIYGFSLIGSILEKIYVNSLEKPIDELPNKLEVPFTVYIEIFDNQQKIIKQKSSMFFVQIK